MADTDETYEIGVEITGIEAAQQAMAALGIGVEQVTDEAARDDGPVTPDGDEAATGEARDASLSSSLDLSGFLEAQERTNELLGEILAAIQGQPKPEEAHY